MCNRPNEEDKTAKPQSFPSEALELTCLRSPVPAPAGFQVPGEGGKGSSVARGSTARVQGGKQELVEFGLGEIHLWMLIHEPRKQK